MLETEGQVVTSLANTADETELSKGSEIGGTEHPREDSGGRWVCRSLKQEGWFDLTQEQRLSQ